MGSWQGVTCRGSGRRVNRNSKAANRPRRAWEIWQGIYTAPARKHAKRPDMRPGSPEKAMGPSLTGTGGFSDVPDKKRREHAQIATRP